MAAHTPALPVRLWRWLMNEDPIFRRYNWLYVGTILTLILVIGFSVIQHSPGTPSPGKAILAVVVIGVSTVIMYFVGLLVMFMGMYALNWLLGKAYPELKMPTEEHLQPQWFRAHPVLGWVLVTAGYVGGMTLMVIAGD